MSTEIINVGDELLTGEAVNTNATYLAGKLQEIGIDLRYETSVRNNVNELKKILKDALLRSSIILITGGLGSGRNDITKEVVSEVFKRRMVLHKPTLLRIQEKVGEVNGRSEKIALIPEGSEILENPVGIVPAIILNENEKEIFLLPGVEVELKSIVEKKLLPYLMKHREKNYIVKQQILRVWGLLESKVEELLKDMMGENKNPLVKVRDEVEGVEVSIIAKGGSLSGIDYLLEKVEEKLKERLNSYVYATGDVSMEKVVGMLLSINKKTLVIAESVTGGLISKKITDIPGSSQYFLGGVVAYSNQSKIRDLGILEELIKKYGAVSTEVCEAMAKGIRSIFSADIGLATTGIAGPKGGNLEKPVGLNYIGLATEDGCKVENYHFRGTRLSIRTQATQAALNMVRKYLIARR